MPAFAVVSSFSLSLRLSLCIKDFLIELFNCKISALHETYPKDFCCTEASVFKQVKVFANGDREEFSVVSGGVVFNFFLGSAGFSFEFFKSSDGYVFSGFSK